MAFTISSFVTDANNDIVSLNWQYTTADGSISNTHTLQTPAGDFSVTEVTQATLVGWLEDQLQNTAAEFDSALAAKVAKTAYEETLTTYSRESDNTYSI